MSDEAKRYGFLMRDGTSQAARRLGALDPDYVAVDERDPRDLLAFAQQYGEELVYFAPDDTADGDWRSFIDPRLDLDALAAAVDQPSGFAGPPHLTLFLTFLKLLGRARAELNGLTRRHLDFYFRQVLRLTNKGPEPDHVRVIFDLARRSAAVRLPVGTHLDAGKDADGHPRLYAIDRDLVVSHAQIAALRSLHVERQITRLGDVFRAHRFDGPGACMAMLELALGDPLPAYQSPDVPSFVPTDFADLETLAEMLRFTTDDLFLSFAQLSYLMKLVREPYPNNPSLERAAWDANRWQEIYRVVELAGQKRWGDPAYTLPSSVPQQDLAAALAAVVDPDFQKLPTELGAITNIEEYDAALRRLEQCFHMSAASFVWLVRTADSGTADAAAWQQVEALLERTHREQVSARRRAELLQIRDGQESALAGFDAMLLFAAGEAVTRSPDPFAIELLRPFLDLEADLAVLVEMRRKLVAGLANAVSEQDWARVAVVVEVAWRRRQNLPEPRAERVEWLNLYAADDATRISVERGEGDLPQWRTFGEAPVSPRREPVPPPILGWALSSPLLALAEGERSVSLHLELATGTSAGLTGKDLQSALVVEASTRDGWVEPEPWSVEVEPSRLSFNLVFSAAAPALAAPKDGGFKNATLRLMLRQTWDDIRHQFTTAYPQLCSVAVSNVQLEVTVDGLRSLRLQHEDSVLDREKPFEPFGNTPGVGSRFLLGHPELAGKKLDRLSFAIEWMDVPKEGLIDYYAGYGLEQPPKSPGDTDPDPSALFFASISWMDRQLERRMLKAKQALLVADQPEKSDTAPGTEPPERALLTQTVELDLSSDDSGTPGHDASGDNLLSWNRYLQWQLNTPDFQHRVYPALAARKATKMAIDIAKNTLDADPDKPGVYQINPPYTPRIKSLRVGYTASHTFELHSAEALRQQHQVFHVHPFGHSVAEPGVAEPGVVEPAAVGISLLPVYDDQGELLIGLRGVNAPENVNLLFEMAEGSADPDLERVPVRWSFLSGDRWQSLEAGRLVLDTTRGLRRSGIVELAVEPAAASTRLGDKLYWIRASIAHNAASVCDTIAIHTQGVSATRVEPEAPQPGAPQPGATQPGATQPGATQPGAPQPGAPQPGAPQPGAPQPGKRQPLAPGTITRLASPRAGIAGVRQPYASYGGAPAEDDRRFDTRVSERLRHKERALSLWDYERLVLERFPKIYKAKCLPRGLFDRPSLAPTARQEVDPPGRVDVVVIPDIRHQRPFDPFAPKASTDVLAEIASHLRAKAPATAAVTVKNAHFVAVQVRCAVRFREAGNEGYNRLQLQEELNRFLSPWAYDDGADIVIGGSIYANSIVDFLDRRPYVDYVTRLRLYKSDDLGGFVEVPEPAASSSEGYRVSAERPDDVLVAARRHRFEDVAELGRGEDLEIGINFMQVELDFIIGGEHTGIDFMRLAIDFTVR